MHVPFGHPEIGTADMIAVQKVLDSPNISVGYDVQEFEEEFGEDRYRSRSA